MTVCITYWFPWATAIHSVKSIVVVEVRMIIFLNAVCQELCHNSRILSLLVFIMALTTTVMACIN